MSKTRSAKVTKTAVENLKENEIIRDTEIKGFGARRRKGAPSYFLQTRINRRLRWITIGKHGMPWTPITARKEALQLLTEIAGGVDPVHKKRKSRKAPDLAEVAELFFDEYGVKLKPATLHDYRSIFRHHIEPALGKRRAAWKQVGLRINPAEDIDTYPPLIHKKSCLARSGK